MNNKFYLNYFKLKNIFVNVKNVKCKNLKFKIFENLEEYILIHFLINAT